MKLLDALKLRIEQSRKRLEEYSKLAIDELVIRPSFRIVTNMNQVENIKIGDLVLNSQTGEVFIFANNNHWTKIIGGGIIH